MTKPTREVVERWRDDLKVQFEGLEFPVPDDFAIFDAYLALLDENQILEDKLDYLKGVEQELRDEIERLKELGARETIHLQETSKRMAEAATVLDTQRVENERQAAVVEAARSILDDDNPDMTALAVALARLEVSSESRKLEEK